MLLLVFILGAGAWGASHSTPLDCWGWQPSLRGCPVVHSVVYDPVTEAPMPQVRRFGVDFNAASVAPAKADRRGGAVRLADAFAE